MPTTRRTLHEMRADHVEWSSTLDAWHEELAGLEEQLLATLDRARRPELRHDLLQFRDRFARQRDLLEELRQMIRGHAARLAPWTTGIPPAQADICHREHDVLRERMITAQEVHTDLGRACVLRLVHTRASAR